MQAIHHRPLVQPFASTAEGQKPSCSHGVSETFNYTHPENLYCYWYKRMPRDGSAKGEFRVQIKDADMQLFLNTRTAATPMRQEGLVNITKKTGGWYLVTAGQMPLWNERAGSFHDALAVWVRAFNLFFLPAQESKVFSRVEKEAKPVVVSASGKITLKRESPSMSSLAALAAKFAK